MRWSISPAVLITAFYLILAGHAAADPLPSPAGAVILTVQGAISNGNEGADKASFDLAMLQALPVHTITTTTPWTEGRQIFTGATLADLLALLGTTGERARAQASNQYEVTFSLTDVTAHGGIIAYLQNGTALPPDKGPLWIVFDYDSDAILLSDRFQNASIWNLISLGIH